MNILCFAFAPISNAGARYRIYKVAPLLRAAGHQVIVLPPMPDWLFRRLYGRLFGKPSGLLSAKLSEYIRDVVYACVVLPIRRKQVSRWASWADVVIVQRELYRPGNWTLESELRSRVQHFIWDYDDALYATEVFGASGHVDAVIRMADVVLAGNETLADYARARGAQAIVMPTSLDAERYVPRPTLSSPGQIVIGWVGNPFNLRHFDVIMAALRCICNDHPEVVLRIVTDGQQVKFPGLRFEYRKWSLAREVEDLASFDIGIMPLLDDEYTRGKCGFKLIQYMAVGLPTVSSPVGINSRIIDDGRNGFLARSNEEWIDKLSRLIENTELRITMGQRAREKVFREYSLEANTGRLITFIEGIAK